MANEIDFKSEEYKTEFMAFVDAAGQRRGKPVSVTFRKRQGWSKDVGSYAKPDGQRTPRRFWLGHDQARAQWLADIITSYHERFVKGRGDALWTDEHQRAVDLVVEMKDHQVHVDAERVRRQLAGFSAHHPVPNLPVMPELPETGAGRPAAKHDTKVATLYAAIEAYLDSMNTKRVSPAHCWRARQVLDGLKNIRKDCPLVAIDYAWIIALCDHYKARPKSKHTGRPFSAETVVTTLRYIRAFFVWLDDVEFGNWEAPRKLLKPFRVRKSDMMEPTELRDAAIIKQFTVPELVKMYRAGSPAQRTWMLTALFIAGTQMELAVLTKSEIGLDAQAIVHYRNKTSVEGRFWIPPELVTLLRDEFKRHPKNPLAFTTEEGRPLVWFDDTGKLGSDAVRLSWDRLRIKAGLPDVPSFKYLRKFAADYVNRHGGESIGQVMLSHSRSTVLAKSYTTFRDFAELAKIQKRMHGEFVKAGMFVPTPVKVKAKRKSRAKISV